MAFKLTRAENAAVWAFLVVPMALVGAVFVWMFVDERVWNNPGFWLYQGVNAGVWYLWRRRRRGRQDLHGPPGLYSRR